MMRQWSSENAHRGFLTGEPFANKYRMRRADGAYRWVDGRRGAAARSRTERSCIGTQFPSTSTMRCGHRRRCANGKRELSQLVDMVPSQLWRLSPEGEPIFFNKRMIEFFGLDVGDLDKPGSERAGCRHRRPSSIPMTRQLAEALNHSFVTGESFSMNYRLRRADGVYRWMSRPCGAAAGRERAHRPVVRPLSRYRRSDACRGGAARERTLASAARRNAAGQ